MIDKLRIQRGAFRGRIVRLPPAVRGNLNATPSLLKEAFFQILEGRLEGGFEEYAFFDLCAGSGQMSMEALSLGFHPVHMAEVDQNRIRFLLDEIKRNGYSIQLHRRDFRRMAPPVLAQQRAVVFLDPPYSFWEKDRCEPVDTFLFNLIFGGAGTSREAGWDGEPTPTGTSHEPPLHRDYWIGIQGPEPHGGSLEILDRAAEFLSASSLETREYRKNYLTILELHGSLPLERNAPA